MSISSAIIIGLRIIPLVLLSRSYSKGYKKSRYFLLFTVLSFVTDILCSLLGSNGIHTDSTFNVYQSFEVIIVTLIALEFGNFKKNIQTFLFILCGIQVSYTAIYSFVYVFNAPQEYNWGLSKLYLLIITFIAAIRYVRNSELTNKLNAANLFGLLGVFIYAALGIIPIMSEELQITYENSKVTALIYYILIASANILKDALLSYSAILNLKKSNQ